MVRTDSRGGSHNSITLSSAQHFTPHRTEVNGSITNSGPQSGQTEANGYLSPSRHETPVVVLTENNYL